MAAVDGKLVRNWTGGRHFLENALPDTALGPTIVAVVDGRRWPIGWRNVAPPASCFQHMQDAGNDSPIVHARFSRLAVRQMGSNVFHASSDSHNKLLEQRAKKPACRSTSFGNACWKA